MIQYIQGKLVNLIKTYTWLIRVIVRIKSQTWLINSFKSHQTSFLLVKNILINQLMIRSVLHYQKLFSGILRASNIYHKDTKYFAFGYSFYPFSTPHLFTWNIFNLLRSLPWWRNGQRNDRRLYVCCILQLCLHTSLSFSPHKRGHRDISIYTWIAVC